MRHLTEVENRSADKTMDHELKVFVNGNEDDAEQLELEESRNSDNFKQRILHTICVCSCSFALGWRNALLGTSLLDLSLITETDLSTISIIFTAKAIGGLAGSICGGFAYDRYNKIGYFTIVMTLMGLTTYVVPWCSHIVAMSFAHVMFGFTAAALSVTSADITTVWKQRAGPFMQTLHGSFSIGSIVSPFVCESFLAKRKFQDEMNLTIENTTVYQVYGNTETNGTTDGNANLHTEQVYTETRIQIPYIVCGCVCLMAVISFLIYKLTLGDVYSYISTDQDRKNNIEQYILSPRLKLVYTIALAISLAIYSVSEYCVTGFLLAFMSTNLGWSKASGSNIVSLFWIAFTVGRFSGIFLVKWVRLSVALVVFFLISVIGAVMLWISVVLGILTLIWVSIATIGYGLSVIMPSLFTWLSVNIRNLTGKVSGLIFICISAANMTIPILLGNLMESYSQMWYIYTITILFIVNMSLFVFILTSFVLLKKQRVPTKRRNSKY